MIGEVPEKGTEGKEKEQDGGQCSIAPPNSPA